ncbi:hypothetical protein ACF0H5_010021 [Mactra antiquata]
MRRTSHITEIGATCESKEFATYIMPKRIYLLKHKLLKVIIGSTMFVKGMPVQALSIRDAIKLFIEYLKIKEILF